MVAGMHFSTATNDHARRIAYRELIQALTGYLNGQERRYAVTEALTEIKIIFHETGDKAANIITQAMDNPDEDARAPAFRHAAKLIQRHL